MAPNKKIVGYRKNEKGEDVPIVWRGIKRKPKHIPYDEVRVIISAIDEPMDRYFIAAMYANGMRVGEAVKITARDISIDEEFVHVEQPIEKKRGKEKDVMRRAPPIDRVREDWLCQAILGYALPMKEAWLKSCAEARLLGKPEPKPPLLWTYKMHTAQRRVDKWFNCTSHSLRHTRATNCFVVLKMNMRQVAEYFRLAPRTISEWVMRYGHLDVQDIEMHLRSIR